MPKVSALINESRLERARLQPRRVERMRSRLYSLLKISRDRPALSFLSFRPRTGRRNLRHERVGVPKRFGTTDAGVTKQIPAVRRRNGETWESGFIAAEGEASRKIWRPILFAYLRDTTLLRRGGSW